MSLDTTTTQTTSRFLRFWEKVKVALLQVVTGKDNQTHDLGRWSWVICTASVLGHDAWQLTHSVPVDIKDLALALSAVAGAHGVALGMKASTEPPIPPTGGTQ